MAWAIGVLVFTLALVVACVNAQDPSFAEVNSVCISLEFRAAIPTSNGDPVSCAETKTCRQDETCVAMKEPWARTLWCCADKPKPTKADVGTCPAETGDYGVCGAVTLCSNDAGCPRTQKCCNSTCGGSVCTNVEVDSCEDCDNTTEVCVDTGSRKECVALDDCGGCDPGELCYGGECHKCTEKCHKGYTCAFRAPLCPYSTCIARLRQECVSKDTDLHCRGGCPDEHICVLKGCPECSKKCNTLPGCFKVKDEFGHLEIEH